MNNLIGWRTTKGMKHQHLTRSCDYGGVTFHCMQTSPDDYSVSGFSFKNFSTELLLTNKNLPKCKKCEKEMLRIERITGER